MTLHAPNRPNRPLGFTNSSTTSCIFTQDNPSIARFGQRGYEIVASDDHNGRHAKIYKNGPTIELWKEFSDKLYCATGSLLDQDAMPFDLRADAFKAGIVDYDVPVLLIDVAALDRHTGIYARNPWTCKPFSLSDVEKAIHEQRFEADPVPGEANTLTQIARIAYLATTPDEWDPIHLVFNYDGKFELHDGNHRAAAAIFLGHNEIAATYEGFTCGLSTTFPSARRRLANDLDQPQSFCA